MSVNQNNVTAYGAKPTGLLSVFNPPIISNRAPTVGDKAPLGTVWINSATQAAWVLTQIAANVAAWGDITGGGGAFMNLSVVPGGIGINLPAPGAGQLAATGNISTTVGDITATAGAVTAGTTVTAGTGINSVTGNIIAEAGDLQAIGDILAINESATANGSVITTQKTRGGLTTIVHAGDSLGQIVFAGADGTQFVDGAVIATAVVGTPGVGRVGTTLTFATHADAATGVAATSRMTLDQTGVLNIAAPDAPQLYSLELLGAGGLLMGSGNLVNTAGSISAGGALIGGTVYSGGDLGGVAASTSITNVTNTTQGAGTLSIKSTDGNSGNNAGFIKVYIGTVTAYVPYFTNIAP